MGDAKISGPLPEGRLPALVSRGFAWIHIDAVDCGWCACLGGPFSAGKLLFSRVLAAAEGGCVASHPRTSRDAGGWGKEKGRSG